MAATGEAIDGHDKRYGHLVLTSSGPYPWATSELRNSAGPVARAYCEKDERRRTSNQIHGTRAPDLLSATAVRATASAVGRRRLMGARDLNADMRPKRCGRRDEDKEPEPVAAAVGCGNSGR